MTTTQAGRIFISYRRDDSAGYAGRIYDRLATHFGKDAIFMDVDTIQAGLDFVEVLENAVQSCDVLVALIGRQWLSIKDSAGKLRLDNPEDFVRIEVAAALKRGIRVIPVLVDGTPMPNSDQLPGNLVSLARRNAVLVNHYSFHNDASRLIEQLELALESAEESKVRKANELKEREARIQHQAKIENLLSQADIALKLQDWELAKEKLDAVLKLESGHGQAQVKLAFVERKQREKKEQNLAKEKIAREKADRESAKKVEEERQAKARIEAERLAALKAQEERLAHEKAESERKAKEAAEKLRRTQAEREAAEKAQRKVITSVVPKGATEGTRGLNNNRSGSKSTNASGTVVAGIIILGIFLLGYLGLSLIPTIESSTEFECTDALGCVDVAPGEPIHIAWIQSVSGATAPLGQTNVNGGQLAVDDRGGELLGHPIQYDGEDSLCNAEGGQAAGTKVSSDPTVVAILGTSCSSEARAAMPLVAAAGMVMMSPSNTNPDLTNPEHPDHHPGYFRTSHNDLFQGRIAAEFTYNELALRTAATVHDGSRYAHALQQVFADVFTELGGTITAQEAVNVGDTDFKPVLTTIASGSPEIIYFPIFEPEGNLFASQKCEVTGLETTALMGADGLFTSGFSSTAGSCAVGMYMSSPYVAGDAMAEFLDKYNATFGEGPASGFAPHAYDALNIFFAAIEHVAVVDADGMLHIPRQALRDALYDTRNFPGLTGTLSCNENGDCATGEALAVYQITSAMVNGTQDLVLSTPIWQP